MGGRNLLFSLLFSSHDYLTQLINTLLRKELEEHIRDTVLLINDYILALLSITEGEERYVYDKFQ